VLCLFILFCSPCLVLNLNFTVNLFYVLYENGFYPVWHSIRRFVRLSFVEKNLWLTAARGNEFTLVWLLVCAVVVLNTSVCCIIYIFWKRRKLNRFILVYDVTCQVNAVPVLWKRNHKYRKVDEWSLFFIPRIPRRLGIMCLNSTVQTIFGTRQISYYV